MLLGHRYIDDILFIWDRPLPLLESFFHALNNNEYNLTFTNHFSEVEIPFLDVLIGLNPRGEISTSLSRKATAGNTLLRANSGHPVPLKNYIPSAQYMHLRRICSSIEEFDTQASHLQRRFLERGYSRSLLKRAYHRAREADRHSLLFTNKEKMRSTTSSIGPPAPVEPTRCILTYSAQEQAIRSIIGRYWFLLTEDPVLSHYVTPHPSITYRRARSLKDELVQSHFIEHSGPSKATPPRITPCGNCDVCQYLDLRSRAILPNGENWTQRQDASCHTMGIIYLLLCPCGSFHVG